MDYDKFMHKLSVIELMVARDRLQELLDIGYPVLDLIFYTDKEIEEREREEETNEIS